MSRPRIAVLQREVIDQIAAGEVVERPASVVKELVENALDAGAGRVDVEVDGGGKALIRVTDDGCGLSPDEARLCLQRYATSKLRNLDDLLSLRTKGFRGEALPSIASVSRLTLCSRTPEAEQGSCVVVEGGREVEQRPAPLRPGTRVQVVDLFYNTPARLKFLKTTATETAHCSEAVTGLALGHPEVHLVLRLDGRTALELPRCVSRLERARLTLTRQGRRLVPATLEASGLSVEACLGPPDAAQRTARQITVLVNGRLIRDRRLVQAVVAGYGALLERGRYPAAVVYIDLDPGLVDVNAHPQKTEVRFREPGQVFGAVRRCVDRAVAQSPWLEQAEAKVGGAPTRRYQVAAPAEGYEEHRRRIKEATERFWSGKRLGAGGGGGRFAQAGGAEGQAGQGRFGAGEARALYGDRGEGAGEFAAPGIELPPTREAPADAPAQGSLAMEERAAGARGYFSALRVVGQVLGTYLVCEGDDALVLLDQHAAHERVVYEGLRRAARGRGVPAQQLLIPQTLELDPRQRAIAERRREELRELGLELAPFGGETWQLRSLPAALGEADGAALTRDLLDELGDGMAETTVQRRLDELLARMACHSSVRAGQAMEWAEIRALLAALDRVDFSAACPHGRPVLVKLPRGELEARFRRT